MDVNSSKLFRSGETHIRNSFDSVPTWKCTIDYITDQNDSKATIQKH